MNVLIRADSSARIGLGHIMRDLVLARQYPNDTVRFACQNLEGNIISSIPYPVHILRSNDPDELIELIREQKIDTVIFDHYGIDAAFERYVKESCGVTLLCLDDTYVPHHCDILLNHNISADITRYKGLVPEHCTLRCGGEYTLIRDEFRLEKSQNRAIIYDLFISMGGTDPTDATSTVLRSLDETYRVCVVTTSGNPHLKELKTLVSSKQNVVLEVDSTRVAQLLHESALAIVTPSVMVHEVLFMGTPFIALQTAPNQKDMADYLETQGYTLMKEWQSDAIARVFNA